MRSFLLTGMLCGVALTGTGCLSLPGLTREPAGSGFAGAADVSGPPAGPSTAAVEARDLPEAESGALCLKMAGQLEQEGKDADAILYYERARQYDARLAESAGRRLAVLFDRVDEQARAMIEYQALLKVRPDDAALLNDVGYSYYNRGAWVDAERHLRRAVEVDPKNSRAWINLGLALAQQDRDQDAVDAFFNAVTPAEAFANLGFVQCARGRKADAAAAYRRALEFEPAFRQAREALSRIESPTADQPGPGPSAGKSPAADG